MSVIVPSGMSIDQALRLLWRESNRENIPQTIRKLARRIKPASIRHNINKEWAKRKRRSRAARRRLERKGQLRKLATM